MMPIPVQPKKKKYKTLYDATGITKKGDTYTAGSAADVAIRKKTSLPTSPTEERVKKIGGRYIQETAGGAQEMDQQQWDALRNAKMGRGSVTPDIQKAYDEEKQVLINADMARHEAKMNSPEYMAEVEKKLKEGEKVKDIMAEFFKPSSDFGSELPQPDIAPLTPYQEASGNIRKMGADTPVFGKLADITETTMLKGSKIYLVGSIIKPIISVLMFNQQQRLEKSQSIIRTTEDYIQIAKELAKDGAPLEETYSDYELAKQSVSNGIEYLKQMERTDEVYYREFGKDEMEKLMILQKKLKIYSNDFNQIYGTYAFDEG